MTFKMSKGEIVTKRYPVSRNLTQDLAFVDLRPQFPATKTPLV